MNNRMNAYEREPRAFLSAGFTLVELIVVMLIAAILAAIAIPSYSRYVLKSHRTDAKSALLDMASLEERYFSVNNAYSSTPSDLGYACTTPFASCTPFLIGNGYYQITNIGAAAATAPTGPTSMGTPATYTITAQATGNQAKDTECYQFTITSTGQQTSFNSSMAPTTDCWTQ